MAPRACRDCGANTGYVMRILVGINMLAGIALIGFGASAEFPIQSAISVGMVLLGVFSIVSALFGIVASYHYRVCLACFLVMGGMCTFGQMVLVICLFKDLNHIVGTLHLQADGLKYDRAHAVSVLTAARVVMLLFVIAEYISLFLAVLLRYVIKQDTAYDAFDPDVEQERIISMQSLRADLEKGTARQSTTNNKIYDKVRSKMATKYGQYSHGTEWKKKSWFSKG